MSVEEPTGSGGPTEPRGDAAQTPLGRQDKLRELESQVTSERARERQATSARGDARESRRPDDKPKVKMMRRRTSGLVALGLILFAFLLGLFAWPFVMPRLQAWLPAGMRMMPVSDVASTEATDALAKRLDALEAKIQALPPAAKPADLAALKAEVDQQSAKTADLGQRLDLAQSDERFADLMKTHEDLSNAIRDLQARVDKLENASPASQDATLLALAATRLRIRAENARPFTADLALVQRLASQVGGLDAAGTKAINDLKPYADAGAPSMRDLVADFPEAARHAQKASAVPEGTVWWRAVLYRIAALVTIRHTGPLKGNSVEARLSRAEARLEANDLAGAIDEVEPIEGKPAEKIDPWLQSAYARLAIDRAAREVEGSAYRAGTNASGPSSAAPRSGSNGAS
jgi:hypothetical protein